MTKRLKIPCPAGGFAEDKDEAKRLRTSEVLPTLERGDAVVLDFAEVRYATQSYIHALIGEALKKHGEDALTLLEFKSCSAAVRSVIELVVDYSLGGFPESREAV